MENIENLTSKLGTKLCSHNSIDLVDTNTILQSSDVVGFYFSADWCPPCRKFTPILIDRYNKLKQANKNFEVVFISNCEDADSHQVYYKKMPWLSLPFDEISINTELMKYVQVEGIPCLALYDTKTQSIITKHADKFLERDDFLEEFPFYPKPIYDLGDCDEGLESEVSFILIQNLASEDIKETNSKA